MSIALTDAYYCCRKLPQRVDIKNEQRFVKMSADCKCEDNNENTLNEKLKKTIVDMKTNDEDVQRPLKCTK
jgi:hypothetical protein